MGHNCVMDTCACFENHVNKSSPVVWGVPSLAWLQTEMEKGRGKALLKGQVVGKEQVLPVDPGVVLSPELGKAGSWRTEELNGRAGGGKTSAD